MWQDGVFLAGNIVLALVLLPTLRDPDAIIPLWTSVPTALTLYVYGATFLTLDLYLSGISLFATALIWTLIAAFRNEQAFTPRDLL